MFPHLLFYFRLNQSEDVQYFQFDATGNMYVFQPGAGFSGIAKKIAPGEDFTATWSDNCLPSTNLTSCLGIASSTSSEIHSDYDCSQFVGSGKTSQR